MGKSIRDGKIVIREVFYLNIAGVYCQRFLVYGIHSVQFSVYLPMQHCIAMLAQSYPILCSLSMRFALLRLVENSRL